MTNGNNRPPCRFPRRSARGFYPSATLSGEGRKLELGFLWVPFLVGRLPREALDELRANGFTGTTRVVPGAWLDGPGGRVTGSRPMAGELVPPDAPLDLYVNPGTPAPLTDEERGVIEAVTARFRRDRERERDPFRVPPDRPAGAPWDEATLEEQARLEEVLAGTVFRGREVRAARVPGGSIGFEVNGIRGELPEAWEEVRELVPVTGRWPLAVDAYGEDVYSRFEYHDEDDTPEAVLSRARAMSFDEVLRASVPEDVSDYVRSDWERIVGYSLEETERRVGVAPGPDEVAAAVPDPDRLALERFLLEYEELRRPTVEAEQPELFNPSYLYDGAYTMAFLPTADPAEVPAYTSFWTCQSSGHERLVLVLGEWNRRYGVEPIANYGTLMALRLAAPPQDLQEAWRAAVEFDRVSDSFDVSLREQARAMLKNPVWTLIGRP